MAASQKPQFTTGNNMYFEGSGTYDQSEYWEMVANNRDQIDLELVEASVTAASGDKRILRSRGSVPEGSNIREWWGSQWVGDWYVEGQSHAATFTGLPVGFEGPGTLSVNSGRDSGYSHTTIFWSRGGGSPSLHWCTLKASGVLNDWTRLDPPWGGEQIVYRGFVPDGQDLNKMYGTEYRGCWYIRNKAHADGLSNQPPGDLGGGPFVVRTGQHGAQHTTHDYAVCSSSPKRWARNSRGSKVFGGWVDLMAGGSSGGDGSFRLDDGHYGTPNSQLISDFEAVTPQISTGNKGAIAFRFDHGLTYLKSDLLALLQSRNWKCIIAMNSRNWDKAENSGMSKVELTALIDTGLVEIGNHTADDGQDGTHKDMDTKDALIDGIVNGKRELVAQIGRPVHHFIVPGTINGMGGFAQGANMDVYSSTYAGSLILANHAVASGGLGEIYRVLDGRTKQCQRHWNIEKRTVATIKARINAAASTKTGLQLMLHPRYIDQPNYLSKAEFIEVLEHIDAKVAANELVVLSTSEMVRATL